jgi:mannose-6-phosphate isomerase-like protein (cupin superfamily)
MPQKRYRFVPPGGGLDYDWTRDHAFVKVAAADTGGAYALMEDNLKREFALGLHLHRQHAETFYILDGIVNFHIDGEWMAAAPGLVYIFRRAYRTRSICRLAESRAA